MVVTGCGGEFVGVEVGGVWVGGGVSFGQVA